VDAGEAVADIGSDHGYLPLLLIRGGVSPRVIVTDVAEGPLARARGNVEEFLDASCCGVGVVECRLGDGLAPLSHGEVDAVVIAGMGGESIIDIMAADPEKTESFAKFILQPRTKTEKLRAWLAESGYDVAAEDVVLERGRPCLVLVVSTRVDVKRSSHVC
jgi:tRNA (adenine22-N1)-methyltransferase